MNRKIGLGLLSAALCLGNAARAHAAAVLTAPPISACAGTPGPNSVYAFTGTNYSGSCRLLLQAGSGGDLWTSWDVTSGFPDNAIRSVRTGANVTLVLFWHSFYTKDNGAPYDIPPNSSLSDLGTWNGQASAARVQEFEFGECGASPSSERVAVFTDAGYNGDCTILNLGLRCYPGAREMGFRNDTISSVSNPSPFADARFYGNANFDQFMFQASEGQQFPNLAFYPPWPATPANDRTSSILGLACP